ncbi:class I SAM-dependent methyltransferase [Candidatus Microgenomates bacterium]|nr:class I SAM-dependent methyltransferase [Candidatus Microgenomates bacterium]
MNYKKYHRDSDYNKMESTFRNIFKKRFELIEKQLSFKKGGTVLEIGCSNGVFLDLFKERGFETWGIEPSKTADRAKKKGHKVLKTTFEKAKLQSDYFDVVVLNHTLEHLKNPEEILKKVGKVLKKDGIVYIDVPNVGSLLSIIMGKRWPYLLPEEHLWQFNKDSITKLVKKSGFRVIYWESRSGIFEYKNPLLELHRKKFVIDILASPYSLLATVLNKGDSMSIIGRKKE